MLQPDRPEGFPLLMTPEELSSVSFSDEVIKQKFILNSSLGHTKGLRNRGERSTHTQSTLEAFICQLMRAGTATSKKERVIKLVSKSFQILRGRGLNPLQVFVDAVISASPKEYYVSTICRGSKLNSSTDVSPLKRIDLSLRNLAIQFLKEGRSKESREAQLAEYLLLASKKSSACSAIKKTEEIERIAKLSR